MPAVPPEWSRMLAAFYPKFERAAEAIGAHGAGGRWLVSCAAPMRFVACTLARPGAALCPTKDLSGTAFVAYAEAARLGTRDLNYILGQNRRPGGVARWVPDNMLRAGLFVGAVANRARLVHEWRAHEAQSAGPLRLVVSPMGGEVGNNYANFTAHAVLYVPSTEDDLEQLLGRIRRLQGLCVDPAAARRVEYLIVCDSIAPPERVVAGAFRSLALPVRASEMVARGGAAGAARSGLREPMTAWDVIAAAAPAPGGAAAPDPPTETFAALDFTSRVHRSTDCMRYLRLLASTYGWKRVVKSSIHDFGVVGPRDLDLGVAGDVQYYEALAETLDEDLALVLNNALTVSATFGCFVPDVGESREISLRVLDGGCAGALLGAAAALHVGAQSRLILQAAGHAAPAAGPWPRPDETSTIIDFIVAGDQRARIAGWDDPANLALYQLAYIFRVLADGGPSSIVESAHEGLLCGDPAARRINPSFAGVAGVELNIEYVAEKNEQLLREVASANIDPADVWFPACWRALMASVCATAMLAAVNSVVRAQEDELPAGNRPQRTIALRNALFHAYAAEIGQWGIEWLGPQIDPAHAGHHFAQCTAEGRFVAQDDRTRLDCIAMLTDSPRVTAGVYAESNRSIVLPCGRVGADRAAACTQVVGRESTNDLGDLDALIQHIATETHFADADHQADARREMVAEMDVFRPVILGEDGDEWVDMLDAWAHAVVRVTAPSERAAPEPPQQQQPAEPPPAPPRYARAGLARGSSARRAAEARQAERAEQQVRAHAEATAAAADAERARAAEAERARAAEAERARAAEVERARAAAAVAVRAPAERQHRGRERVQDEQYDQVMRTHAELNEVSDHGPEQAEHAEPMTNKRYKTASEFQNMSSQLLRSTRDQIREMLQTGAAPEGPLVEEERLIDAELKRRITSG